MANFNILDNSSFTVGTGEEIDFYTVLKLAREKILEENPDFFSELGEVNAQNGVVEDKTKREKIYNLIRHFVNNQRFNVKGVPNNEVLTKKLFQEFVDYSILTDYINNENNDVEEVNVNAWDDVEVRYSNGEVKKVEHFCNPEHAENVVKRLSIAIDSKMDDSVPMGEGSLSSNVRVVTLIPPVLDNGTGGAASIRLLKPNMANREFFINNGTITEKEMKFLELAIKSGVSIVFVGETGCGKTTLMNYLLSTVPNHKRIVTIEHNARELSLIKRDDKGAKVNNVVHTQTMAHSNEALSVSQEDLLVKALRLDPNIICVGEMRDAEAYAAQEASLTGHPVITSLHADGVQATHFRIAMLALKRYSVDINIALLQAQMAFPIIVYMSKLEDNSRRVMEISECCVIREGTDILSDYNTLFEYEIIDNKKVNGKFVITGEHRANGSLSDEMIKRMMRNGATFDELDMFGYKLSTGQRGKR